MSEPLGWSNSGCCSGTLVFNCGFCKFGCSCVLEAAIGKLVFRRELDEVIGKLVCNCEFEAVIGK